MSVNIGMPVFMNDIAATRDVEKMEVKKENTNGLKKTK